MFDIAADVFRAVITGAIFLYLRSMRGKEPPRLRKAWVFFVAGFGLLFFGGLVNIAANFPVLDKYFTIGRRDYTDFLEHIIGYIVGLLFLAAGFWSWIPAIIALRAEEDALRKSEAELRQRIVELTAERNRLQARIECELGYAARDDAAQQPAGDEKKMG
jgi:hypothetical protein